MAKNNKSLILDLNDTSRETAKALYDRLENDRKPYTDRAEINAQYTIPALFPKSTDTASTEYTICNQSVGARGINNLASKLLLALFPANTTFFRLDMKPEIEKQYLQTGQSDVKQKIEQALMQMEQLVLKYIETHQIRVTIKEALLQLLVAGNALLFLPPAEGGSKLYRLNSYVVQRDALGNVLTIIAKDILSYASCPPEVRAMLDTDGAQRKPETPVEVYTHTYFDGEQFQSYQEVNQQVLKGSEQTYPLEKTPWIALRFTKIDGASYGRSYVEEYIGDLKALDGHSEALLNASIIASNILYLVDPTGTTQARKLAKAKSGDFVAGRPDDVKCLQLDKTVDMKITLSTVDKLEQRLAYVFMLNSAVQRDAERVTAEEIRYVAGELEDTLGGTYSILSQELQLPLVRRLMVQLERIGDIPELPEGTVEPAITTGLEAIGRGHDASKINTFLQYLKLMPDAMQYIHVDSLLLACATSIGLDTTGLVKTQEEIAQEMQQAQMAQMAQSATPELAKGFVQAQQQPQQPQQG